MSPCPSSVVPAFVDSGLERRDRAEDRAPQRGGMGAAAAGRSDPGGAAGRPRRRHDDPD